jgi:hypothetical protein
MGLLYSTSYLLIHSPFLFFLMHFSISLYFVLLGFQGCIALSIVEPSTTLIAFSYLYCGSPGFKKSSILLLTLSSLSKFEDTNMCFFEEPLLIPVEWSDNLIVKSSYVSFAILPLENLIYHDFPKLVSDLLVFSHVYGLYFSEYSQ